MISTPRSTAADQPAPLPDYKVTWLWGGGGGGMVSTLLNCCRPACPVTGLQSNMALGGGNWGGHGKHTRSTAADQPALLPDYKVTWLWGGGGGGAW